MSRLLYLGSQFFIELLLSVEQNINRPALQLILIGLFRSMEVNFDLLCLIPYVALSSNALTYDHLFCFNLGSQFLIKLLLSVSRLLYLGSQFFIKLLLSVSRLLYLGSQFFIELLLSVEQKFFGRISLTAMEIFRKLHRAVM